MNRQQLGYQPGSLLCKSSLVTEFSFIQFYSVSVKTLVFWLRVVEKGLKKVYIFSFLLLIHRLNLVKRVSMKELR